MAMRQIRKDGDPDLRKKAAPVARFSAPLHRLIEDMIETMQESNGVGLAAPQVGIAKRIIVVRHQDDIFEIINPEIAMSRGEVIDVEGCLSCPGAYGEVTRAAEGEVEGKDRDGNDIRVTGQDLLARILQHEIDHLEGILFLDRAIRLLDEEEIKKMNANDR